MADFVNGWLYEAGIGETRAMRLENGELIQIRAERTDGRARAGAVVEAKFTRQWVSGRSGIITLADGQEALLQPLPKGLTEGSMVRVEIVRAAMTERGGQAKTGRIDFEGGRLLVSLTPAMTLFDVDGPLAPFELAKRAAKEIALALVRFDISGNIGVDFPTLQAKAERAAVTAIFDEYMTANCERTAINGFGFMQIVSRKLRPSVLEIMQANRSVNAALQLLRQAERDRGTGAMRLDVHPAVANKMQPMLLEELARRTGRPVSVEPRGEVSIDGGSTG